MRVRKDLLVGLVALSLFSGTVLAQAPPQPQGGVWDGGQFKAQNLPGPEQPKKPEDNSSSEMGMWIMIAVGVGVVLWLLNKPKQRLVVLGPVTGRKQGGGCAVLIVAGAALLALAGIALACL